MQQSVCAECSWNHLLLLCARIYEESRSKPVLWQGWQRGIYNPSGNGTVDDQEFSADSGRSDRKYDVCMGRRLEQGRYRSRKRSKKNRVKCFMEKICKE